MVHDSLSPPFNLEEYEVMDFDVLIVGAGPSGLATAIRLQQQALERNEEISICVLEKGPEVGRHILSGAVLDPKSLALLLPQWEERNPPLDTPAKKDLFWFLSKKRHFTLPTPPQMKNHGNFIISLGQLCAWLATIAEDMGVNIFPGFAATATIPDHENQGIKGVITGDMGRLKNGQKGPAFQKGIAILARQTVIAEGCRGSLAQDLISRFQLRKNSSHQTYALGIKELWEIQPHLSSPGTIIHTIGWPLDQSTYGGSFIYHLNNHKMALGFVTGLDYKNPHLSPYNEFQRFKHHPSISAMLKEGRRISYGARSLNEGGFQAIPELVFPGGMLVGDSAGFLNVPKIKGIHTSMMSGIIAADTIFQALLHHKNQDTPLPTLSDFPSQLKKSWLWDELYRVRNIRPSFHFSLLGGLAYSAIDTYILRGRAPWTLSHQSPDHAALLPKDKTKPIHYPKPDGILSFDRLSNLPFSGTNHTQDQPCHLKLKDPLTPTSHNLPLFDAPEQRFCPAGVYEIVHDEKENTPSLQINAQNCLHCKACDIKDHQQNIIWTPPQGGEGPNYESM